MAHGIALLLTSCTALRSLFGAPTGEVPPLPPRPDAGLPEVELEAPRATAPIWLEGPMLRAATVALDDLRARNNRPSDSPYMSALFSCLGREEAYDVQVIREETDRWVVFLLPRPWRCFDAGSGDLLAPGATYEVSKGDFHIISADFGDG